jgi:hypothetical protein
MTKMSGLVNAPIFCPFVGDFYSGTEITIPLFKSQLLRGGIDHIANDPPDNIFRIDLKYDLIASDDHSKVFF